MSDDNYVGTFRQSLRRLSEDERRREFFDGFYERFLGSDEAVARFFANTDFNRQHEVLRWSLLEMANFFIDRGRNEEILKLAQSHGPKGYDIPMRMYDLWLESLMSAVRAFDPDWSRTVEEAWRRVLQPGLDYMKFAVHAS
jgi:hypothetical protein